MFLSGKASVEQLHDCVVVTLGAHAFYC